MELIKNLNLYNYFIIILYTLIALPNHNEDEP